jgi:regulator of sigma E protease
MSWFLAIAGICALIVLHEFGHFAVAKAVGMRVERFSLFFGPMLAKVRRGETVYGIGVLPLGGYVKITGMNPEELLPSLREHAGELGANRARVETDGGPPRVLLRVDNQWRDVTAELAPETVAAAVEDYRRGYFRQAPWKRIAVILAGPGMNFLVAFVIYWAMLLSGSIGGDMTLQALTGVRTIVPSSSVLQIDPSAPAARVLKPGDKVVAVDGRRGSFAQDAAAIHSHSCPGVPPAAPRPGCRAAVPVTLTVLRDGHRKTISVRPRYDSALKLMLVGFSYGSPQHYSVLTAAGAAVDQIWHITTKTVDNIGHAITSPKVRRQLHSIVGITDVTQQSVSFGPAYALVILGFVSLALAVVNLFPFLPLDGGHVLWAVAEKVRGRPVSLSAMLRYSSVGIVLLAFLVINGFGNDIRSLTGS